MVQLYLAYDDNSYDIKYVIFDDLQYFLNLNKEHLNLKYEKYQITNNTPYIDYCFAKKPFYEDDIDIFYNDIWMVKFFIDYYDSHLYYIFNNVEGLISLNKDFIKMDNYYLRR